MAEAEYHSSRSPGGRSATRNGESTSRSIIAPAYRVSSASSAYSGPSWAISSGSWPSPGDQMRTSRSRSCTRSGRFSIVPSSAGHSSHSGGTYSGASATDFSPKTPGARSGLPGSHTTSVPPSGPETSSWYSSRSSRIGGRRSTQPPSSRSNAGSSSGRSEHSRTTANRSSGSSTRSTSSMTAPRIADDRSGDPSDVALETANLLGAVSAQGSPSPRQVASRT